MANTSDTPPYRWKTVRVSLCSTLEDMYAEREYLIKYVLPEIEEWCQKWKLHLVDSIFTWSYDLIDQTIVDVELELAQAENSICLFLVGNRCSWLPQIDIPESFFYFRDAELPVSREVSRWPGKQRHYQRAFFDEDDAKGKVREKIFQQSTVFRKFNGDKLVDRVFTYTPVFDVSLANPEDKRLQGRFVAKSLWEFGERVREDLKQRISSLFQKRIEALWQLRIGDSWQAESDLHESFSEIEARSFVGRGKILEHISRYVWGCENEILVLWGEEGCGKSAILAKSYQSLRDLDNVVVISHFVGASPQSTDVSFLLERMCRELTEKHQIDEEIPHDSSRLAMAFKNLLSRVKQRTVLLIDSLERLHSSELQPLYWLPQHLPENVKIIASATSGELSEILASKTNNALLIALLEPEEVHMIIEKSQCICQKEIKEELLAEMESGNDAIGNPLYLKLAMQKLQHCSSKKQVKAEIARFPENLRDFFCLFLEELQECYPPDLVRMLFCLVYCSRYGISSEELQELLLVVDEDNTYRILLRELRDYFQRRGNLLDFFHASLAKAVEQQFLDEEQVLAWHQFLAVYFQKQPLYFDLPQKNANSRKLADQPYQQTKGQMWQELEETLCDLCFVEAKIVAGEILELQRDYELALHSFPQRQRQHQQNQQRCREMTSYIGDILAYGGARDGMPPNILNDLPKPIAAIEPISDRKIAQNKKEFLAAPENIARIQMFHHFIQIEFGKLSNLYRKPEFDIIQHACNWAQTGPLVEQAENIIKPRDSGEIFVSLHPALRREYAPGQAIWRTFTTEDCLQKIAISWDGCLLAAGDTEKIYVWNLDTGVQLYVLSSKNGFWGSVMALAMTPDGRYLLAGTRNDRKLRRWDLATGEYLGEIATDCQFFDGSQIAISSSGHIALGIGYKNNSKVLYAFHMEAKRNLWTRQIEYQEIRSLIFSADSRSCIITYGTSMVVLDMQNGHSINYFEATGRVAVSADGGCIVGQKGKNILVWNQMTGEKKKFSTNKKLDFLHLSCDGKVAISRDQAIAAPHFLLHRLEKGSIAKKFSGNFLTATIDSRLAAGKRGESIHDSETIVIWDLEHGHSTYPPQQARKHAKLISCLAITPDEKCMISSSEDAILHVWDVDSMQCLRKQPFYHRSDSKWHVFATSYDARVWFVKDNSQEEACIQIWDAINGQQISEDAACAKARCLAVGIDAGLLLAGGIDNGQYHLLDIRSKTSANLPCFFAKGQECSGQIEAIAISPDGQLAASSEIDARDEKRRRCFLMIWHIAGRELLHSIASSYHTTSLSFSPCGRYLATTGNDNIIRLWRIQTGKCVREFVGHDYFVKGVCFSDDGMTVISTSADRSIRLWCVDSGRCLRHIALDYGAWNIAIRGNLLAIGGENYQVLLYHLHNIRRQPPIVTAVRFFDWTSITWEREISAICAWCGAKETPSPRIWQIVQKTSQTLVGNRTPCYSWPDSVFANPELVENCSHCGRAIRYNPFFVSAHGENGIV